MIEQNICQNTFLKLCEQFGMQQDSQRSLRGQVPSFNQLHFSSCKKLLHLDQKNSLKAGHYIMKDFISRKIEEIMLYFIFTSKQCNFLDAKIE